MQQFTGSARVAGEAVEWSVRGDVPPETLHMLCDELVHTLETHTGVAELGLVSFRELAFARQCFYLARAATEAHASDFYRLLVRMRDAFALLERMDARFTHHHSLAVHAAQLAGEFYRADAEAVLDELEHVLPQPVEGPGASVDEEFAVVDDMQPAEHYAQTRMPSLEHLEVREVTEVDEFIRPGRVVFPRKLRVPDADFYFARLCEDGAVVVEVGSLPAEARRELRARLDAALDVNPVSAVEYFTECAYARTCLEFIGDSADDPVELLAPYVGWFADSVKVLAVRDSDLLPAYSLAMYAKRAIGEGDIEVALDAVVAASNWLPPDFRAWLPDDLERGEFEAHLLLDDLPDSGAGFIRVEYREPAISVVGETWQIQDYLDVAKLGEELTLSDVDRERCFIFPAISLRPYG